MKLRNIFAVILFFLPFAYALVLDLKVPVKIYELAFLLFLFFWLTQQFLRGEIKLDFDRGFRPLLYYYVWAVFVTIIGYFGLLQFSTFPDWVARGSFFLNPAVELAYLLMNILLAIFISKLIGAKKDIKAVIYILLLGNILVCLYGLYQFFGQLLQFPVITLPTMKDARQNFGFVLPRVAATFKEPNFFAGYLNALIPLAVTLFLLARRKGFGLLNHKLFVIVLILVQLLALLLSFSTAGLIAFTFSMIFYAFLYGWKFRAKRRSIVLAIVLFLVLGCVVIRLFNLGGIFNMVVVDKLFSSEINPMTHSRMERSEQALAAITLFMRHPMFGIGLANFGLYFDQELGIKYGFEATANNIYAKMLAETGLIGLILFLGFFFSMFKRFYRVYQRLKVGEDLLLLIGIWTAVFAILVGWNFFPSYSLAFFWVIFGLAIGYLRSLEAELDGSKS